MCALTELSSQRLRARGSSKSRNLSTHTSFSTIFRVLKECNNVQVTVSFSTVALTHIVGVRFIGWTVHTDPSISSPCTSVKRYRHSKTERTQHLQRVKREVLGDMEELERVVGSVERSNHWDTLYHGTKGVIVVSQALQWWQATGPRVAGTSSITLSSKAGLSGRPVRKSLDG